MDGDALEVALALMQMPSMRIHLRQRPLPAGVDEVVALAAGLSEPMEQAALRTGELPERLQEAARFYVCEVMLFPGADAYRMLGVSPGAGKVRIRQHFLHLQLWLHPDRNGDDWESVFAARINGAWNQLRTPARRKAYNLQLASAPVEREVPAQLLIGGWQLVPEEAGLPAQRRWLLVAIVLLGSVFLLWVLLRQVGEPPESWYPDGLADEQRARAGGDTHDEGAGLAQNTSEVSVDAVLLAQAERGASSSSLASVREAPALAPALEPAASPTIMPMEPDPSMVRLVTMIPASASASASLSVAVTEERGEACIDGREDACVGAAAGSPRASLAVVLPADVKPIAVPVAAVAIVAPDIRLPVKAVNLPEVVLAPDQISVERLELAQRRGAELLRYLVAKAERAPPIWNSVDAQDGAARVREVLGRRDRVRFGEPNWRIDQDQAVMEVITQFTGSASGGVVLYTHMRWREGMWLVDRVEAEGLQ